MVRHCNDSPLPLPVSLCRAHVDGPGIPPNDSENHTQYAFPCPRAFVGLVTTACVFIAYGLGQLPLARTFKVFFVNKKHQSTILREVTIGTYCLPHVF